jgi:hypothetical protein
MVSSVVMKPRMVAAILIRVVTAILALELFMALVGSAFTLYSTLKATQYNFSQQYLTQLFGATGYSLVYLACLVLAFIKADWLSGLVMPDGDLDVLQGDPFVWAAPALQIVGLVFLSTAAANLCPAFLSLKQHLDAPGDVPLDRNFWNTLWTIFVKALMGFLMFRNPKWITDQMRHFSKEAH